MEKFVKHFQAQWRASVGQAKVCREQAHSPRRWIEETHNFMVDKNKWAVMPESGWEMHVLYVQIEVSHDQKYMEK